MPEESATSVLHNKIQMDLTFYQSDIPSEVLSQVFALISRRKHAAMYARDGGKEYELLIAECNNHIGRLLRLHL